MLEEDTRNEPIIMCVVLEKVEGKEVVDVGQPLYVDAALLEERLRELGLTTFRNDDTFVIKSPGVGSLRKLAALAGLVPLGGEPLPEVKSQCEDNPQDEDTRRLGRWANTLNRWGWPADMPGRPIDWEDLPRWYDKSGEPPYSVAVVSRATIARGIQQEIERQIGRKEISRYHHVCYLGYTNEEFEEWWAHRDDQEWLEQRVEERLVARKEAKAGDWREHPYRKDEEATL